MEAYQPIAQAIEALLHPHAEVVIHDLRSGQIAAIFNPFSNRRVGEDSLLSLDGNPPDLFEPYSKVEMDGRQLRSASATLRDANGEAIGLLCINLDVSVLGQARDLLSSFIAPIAAQPDALFADDWREKINRYVAQYLREKQRSLGHLSAEEKRDLIFSLRAAGAFEAKRAAAYIADALQIARSTVYKYLKEMK